MRVALAGTPGTGKTTVGKRLDADGAATVIHLNDAIREHDLWTERDAERDSLVADVDAVEAWLAREVDGWAETTGDGPPVVVESHLAHHLAADRVVVLRCHPDPLADRLGGRDEPDAGVRENRESEALDVILAEAVERHGRDRVHEIDTTDRPPAAVADEVRAVLAGDREPAVGVVDFSGVL